ncbi:MAG: glycosyltransferase family 2 protein [Lachnospiraceae bacterium]|nr:glycosyltransferase family 2 protein [Lachnospiraceae bacterium]
MKKIKYNIERIEKTRQSGAMTWDITGWCFFDLRAPGGLVLRRGGQEIEAQIKWRERGDVRLAYEDLPEHERVGFTVTASVPAGSDAPLELFVKEPLSLATGEGDASGEVRLWTSKENRAAKRIEEELRRLYHKLKNLRARAVQRDYHTWQRRFALSSDDLEKQQTTVFAYAPKVSILVPTYRTPEEFLREMIASVQAQSYRNWELILADASGDDSVAKVALHVAEADERVRYVRLENNAGIAENTNEALRAATGELIGLLDHDDLLTPDAVYEMVRAFNEDSETDAAYSDEDKVRMDGKEFFEPHFKPDFSPVMLRSDNYICHFFVVRRELIDALGGERGEFNGSQDYDLILRVTEKARRVAHIHRVLYHWRMHKDSTAANPESKMYAFDAGKRAIQAQLDRLGVKGTVEHTEHLGFYRVDYAVETEPKVSILIPNKDQAGVLRRCLESLRSITAYQNYEILVIENNSTEPETFAYYEMLKADPKVRVVTWTGKGFNYSSLNNFGAAQTDGEYILLLNNDTEIITPDWLTRMVGSCMQPGTAAVGAKLFYPNDTNQHAGVIIGLGGIAGHMCVKQPRNFVGYFARAKVMQDLSAVTAACMLVRRSVFEELGGLNEKNLAVAFNDVDLCLRIRKAGWRIVMDPNVQLYHHESISRGDDLAPAQRERFERECDYMYRTWKKELADGDPFYSPYFSLVAGQDFQLKWG